jgi:hypothetical protein
MKKVITVVTQKTKQWYVSFSNYLSSLFQRLILFVRHHVPAITAKVLWLFQLFQFKIVTNLYSMPWRFSYYIQMLARKYGFYIFTVCYFIPFFIICYYIRVTAGLFFSLEDAHELFIGVGTMVGGSLAIVASFALFTVQNASSNLPKDFYRVATDIKKYYFIFLFDCFISAVFFLFALFYGRLHLGWAIFAFPVATILFGFSFYLLFLLLLTTKEDVDPNRILSKVSSELHASISIIYSRTERHAKNLLLHPQNRSSATLSSLMIGLFQTPVIKQQFNYINERLDYLFDYHDELLASKEKSAAFQVLEQIKYLVLHYLGIRKNSSLALPVENALFVLTSDSQYVLQPILERMNRLSEDYVRSEDSAGLIKVVDIYIAWVAAASGIQYLGLSLPENPIVGQISGYFNQLMHKTVKLSSLEGMFQGVRFYKYITDLAIKKNFTNEVSSNMDMLEEIGLEALKTRQEPVIQEVFEAVAHMARSLVESGNLQDMAFPKLMRHIETLTVAGYILTIAGTLKDNTLAQQDVAKPYRILRDLVYEEAGKGTQVETAEEREKHQRMTLRLLKEFRVCLRQIADKVKHPNHFLVLSFGNAIEAIGVLLVSLVKEPRWDLYAGVLTQEVKAYLNIPPFFINEAKKINDNSSFDSLIEAVTRIGMESINNDLDELARTAQKILADIADLMLDKEKGEGAMYVEPDIMEKASYISIFALKKAKASLVSELKERIVKFEEKYTKTYFSKLPEGSDPYRFNPAPDKLKKDLEQLNAQREVYNYDRLGLEDSQELLFNLVETQDIEKFIRTIWE